MIDIGLDNGSFVAEDYGNRDISRFAVRIKAPATALKLLGYEGRYSISHKNGVINIEKGLKNLKLNDVYSREDIHAVFSPETTFTPSARTWGLQRDLR